MLRPMPSDPDSPNVIVLPPLLYVAALAAGLLLSWAVPCSRPGDGR